MTIHILGNGPSVSLFNPSDWPDTDVRVGCNFSDPTLSPQYTVIVDIRAMRQFRGGSDSGYRLSIPAVLSDRAYNHISDSRGGWDRIPNDLINVVDVIPLIRDKSISKDMAMNSGQHAAVYAIGKTNAQETGESVHLWGCDSFWTDDIRSSTDYIVGHRRSPDGSRTRKRIIPPWHEYWRKIFTEYPTVPFYIQVGPDIQESEIQAQRYKQSDNVHFCVKE